MQDYFQPDFYHFSEDSTCLANYYFSKIRDEKDRNVSFLDLGAGCGIIGLEVCRKLRIESLTNYIDIGAIEFDFCELQNDFQVSLIQNLNAFRTEIAGDKNMNYSFKLRPFFINASHLKNNQFKEKYDVIFSNLPYFNIHRSRMTTKGLNVRKCKFYSNKELIDILSAIDFCLKIKGVSYVLHRESLSNLKIYSDLFKERNLEFLTMFGKTSLYKFS